MIAGAQTDRTATHLPGGMVTSHGLCIILARKNSSTGVYFPGLILMAIHGIVYGAEVGMRTHGSMPMDIHGTA